MPVASVVVEGKVSAGLIRSNASLLLSGVSDYRGAQIVSAKAIYCPYTLGSDANQQLTLERFEINRNVDGTFDRYGSGVVAMWPNNNIKDYLYAGAFDLVLASSLPVIQKTLNVAMYAARPSTSYTLRMFVSVEYYLVNLPRWYVAYLRRGGLNNPLALI
jgi:hypothetical protein